MLTKTKRCIAVVDDELSVREALGRLLRSAGYSVVLFASGSDFLLSLTEQRPDCVILDFAMPGMSGLDIVYILMAAQMDVPAIIVTAQDDAELERDSLDAGARALLRKPIREDQLFAAIELSLEDRARMAVH